MCKKSIEKERHWSAKFCMACAKIQLRKSSKASKKVKYAVKGKKILSAKKLKCVDCGQNAFCYDHRDYSKPMKIVPVCQGCNVLRGPSVCSKNAPQPVVVTVKVGGVNRVAKAIIDSNGWARIPLPYPLGFVIFKRYQLERRASA